MNDHFRGPKSHKLKLSHWILLLTKDGCLPTCSPLKKILHPKVKLQMPYRSFCCCHAGFGNKGFQWQYVWPVCQ